MGTGTAVSIGDVITATKMNLKLESVDVADIIGEWRKIYDYTPTSAISDLTVPNLNGDEEVAYWIICYYDRVGASSCFDFHINGDATYVYTKLRFRSDWPSTTPKAVKSGVGTVNFIGFVGSQPNEVGFGEALLYARTGKPRTCLLTNFPSEEGLNLDGWTWQNTDDNITSLYFKCSAGDNSFGTNSRLIIFALSK